MSAEPTPDAERIEGPPSVPPSPVPEPPRRRRLRWGLKLAGALAFVLVVLLWFPLHDHAPRRRMEMSLAAGERREVEVAAPMRGEVNGTIESAWPAESGNDVEIAAFDASGREVGHVRGRWQSYSLRGSIDRVTLHAGDAPARVTLQVLYDGDELLRSERHLQMLGVVLLIPFLMVAVAALSPWMARDRSTPCVRKRTGWIAIVIVGAPLAASVFQGIVSLIEHRHGGAPADTPLRFVAWAMWLWVGAVVVIALASLERRAIGGRLLEMRASPGPVLVAMLALCAMWYGWKLIAWLAPHSLGGTPWRIDSTETFPAAVLLAVSAGISEEIVIHGFLLTRLRELTGNATLAVLATSVVFGLLHMYASIPHASFSVLFSLILGVVTLGSQNLFPAILAHAAWDFIWTVIATYDGVAGLA